MKQQAVGYGSYLGTGDGPAIAAVGRAEQIKGFYELGVFLMVFAPPT